MGYLKKKKKKKKNTIPKHILKGKERVLTVLCGKNMDWMGKWYQIYTK